MAAAPRVRRAPVRRPRRAGVPEGRGGGAAASEGLGAPVKAGIAAGGGRGGRGRGGGDRPRGRSAEAQAGGAQGEAGGLRSRHPAEADASRRSRSPSRRPRPADACPRARAEADAHPEADSQADTSPEAGPEADARAHSEAPPPPPAPAVYQLNELSYAGLGDGTKPEIRPGESSWVWQRYGLRIADKQYANGVTVHANSSVTIDLNRAAPVRRLGRCRRHDARHGSGAFSVYADGVRLWRSQVLRGGDPAVPVHLNLAGRKAIRLVTEPQTNFDSLAVGDWAESLFTCR